MKFDKQLFSLSMDAYDKCNLTENNDIKHIQDLQSNFLKALLKKIEVRLKSDNNIYDGVLKFYFVDHWRRSCDEGFAEIEDLVDSDNFNSFAREYCIYLGEVVRRVERFQTQYYEVIWDCKTYFEQLRTKPNAKIIISESKTKNHQKVRKLTRDK